MKLTRLLLVGILIVFIWGVILAKTASPQLVESRINNLESDLRRMELRLNQIEYQGIRNRQSNSARTTITSPSGNSRRLSSPEKDKMLDRLATLVVELKQQINKLESRVSKLESR